MGPDTERHASFMDGGGAMGALMRAYDWEISVLGPTQVWPQSLRGMIRAVLNNSHPMSIFWGPELIQFYNDAYAAMIGPEHHPSSLGAPAAAVWADVWHVLGPQIDFVMAGKGSTWHEDQLLPLTRDGKLQDAWWTYSFAPIDLEGEVGGVLVVSVEMTLRHLANESLKSKILRLAQLFDNAPGFVAILRGPDHIYEFTNAAYRSLVGERDYIGNPVRTVVPEVVGQGFVSILDGVFRTGIAHVGQRTSLFLQSGSGGPLVETFVDFVYEPTIEPDGQISGIFVQGNDVTAQVRTERAEIHLRNMNNELKHLIKNTLAIVTGIARQTFRGLPHSDEVTAFTDRLVIFGKAHDILSDGVGTSATINEVVQAALEPHHNSHDRVSVGGPPLTLTSRQTLALALALHELATNAIKYGALSNAVGKVAVSWFEDTGQVPKTFHFRWQEYDGPSVSKPVRTGVGTLLIERILTADFGGEVALDYAPRGFACDLTAPMANIGIEESAMFPA